MQETNPEVLSETLEQALRGGSVIYNHVEGNLGLILKVMGLMCDGQNKSVQVSVGELCTFPSFIYPAACLKQVLLGGLQLEYMKC